MSKLMEKKLQYAEEQRQKKLDSITSDPYIGYDSIQAALDDARCTTQAEVMARLLNRENLFISGPAGSGKTTIIKRFIDLMDAKFNGAFDIAVTASTGIAATLIEGRTLQSWAGLGIDDKPFDRSKLTPQMFNARDRIRFVDVLIIDEVSMLPGHLITKLDALMKHFRKSKEPFGGVQLVVLGDFMQLPPVAKKEAIDRGVDVGFAYDTEAWKNANIVHCYMDKVHRAADPKLKEALTLIANDRVNDDVRNLIEKRRMSAAKVREVEEKGDKVYTRLFTTKRNVEGYNEEELEKNPNRLMSFPVETHGVSKEIADLMKNREIPDILYLKKGAKIIITSNINDENGEPVAANGSLGEVLDFERGTRNPIIRFNDGSIHTLQPMPYEQEKETQHSYNAPDPKDKNKTIERFFTVKDTVATVLQYPIKLGYAITVHKSQGQTFDGVVVDLSNTFQAGLGYVALSRVRSLDDLMIAGFHPKAYSVNSESLIISRQVKRSALKSREEFAKAADYYDKLLKADDEALAEHWDVSKSGTARKSVEA